MPNHIAIIMDGNGRWGLKKYNNRLKGHEFGVKNIKFIIQACIKKKIKNLTFFALSKDNLQKRNKNEIKNLFLILENYLKENIENFKKKKIKLNFIGEAKNLPSNTLKILRKYGSETNFKKKKIQINIAFNYSSKYEIINACKNIVKNSKVINSKNISKYLYTHPAQDPEILIRTGGFSRLSDFLLWQCSYSEIFFVKKLWPDFKSSDLKIVIEKFKKLKRKFGS
jgi:undecaprenyl diphosphate synthase